MSRKPVSKQESKPLLYTPLFIATALGFYASRCTPAHIVFDLGGVLFNLNSWGMCRRVGFLKLLYYLLWERKNPRNLLYQVLNDIDISDVSMNMFDAHGDPLPKAMVSWFLGKVESYEICESVQKMLNEHPTYCNALEKKIILGMVSSIFNPKVLAHAVSLNKDGVDFVHECVKQGHHIYILSNWDAESFEIVRKRFAHFFDLFDGIIVSGQVKCAKPDPAIFYYLIDQYQLDPAHTLFIDDQLDNVKAAEAVGMNAIKCPKVGWFFQQDFDTVRSEYASWQIERVMQSHKKKSKLLCSDNLHK